MAALSNDYDVQAITKCMGYAFERTPPATTDDDDTSLCSLHRLLILQIRGKKILLSHFFRSTIYLFGESKRDESKVLRNCSADIFQIVPQECVLVVIVNEMYLQLLLNVIDILRAYRFPSQTEKNIYLFLL